MSQRKKKKKTMTQQMKVKLNFTECGSRSTRQSEENKARIREYWRVMKAKSRGKIYAQPQKHRRQKEHERKRKHEATVANRPHNDCHDVRGGFKSKQSLYNCSSKVRKVLPESPTKFAQVKKLIANVCTPHKRKSVESLLGNTAKKQ